MWSDPAHTALLVGMEFGTGKEIEHVGVFSDTEFGSIDLLYNSNLVGSYNREGIVMDTTGGLIELQGHISVGMILIAIEEIETGLYRITEIEEIATGPVSLTIDHRTK